MNSEKDRVLRRSQGLATQEQNDAMTHAMMQCATDAPSDIITAEKNAALTVVEAEINVGRPAYAHEIAHVKTRIDCETVNKRLLLPHELITPKAASGRRCSYRNEGDDALETSAMKMARKRLKHHDGIVANIKVSEM